MKPIEITHELQHIEHAMEAEAPAESLDELVERKRREQGLPHPPETTHEREANRVRWPQLS